MGVMAVLGVVLSVVSSVVMGALNKPKTQAVNYTLAEGGTIASNNATIPMTYGEVKTAGNRIWREIAPNKKSSLELQCVSYGEIQGFIEVKVNDKHWWEWTDKSGRLINLSLYTGNGTQTVDNIVPGEGHIGKARTVGAMRKDAYAAISYRASEDLTGEIAVEYIIQGRKVRVYSDEDNYIIKYTDNPAWCIFDFLTNENGLGIPHEDLNIGSFIASASYCDDIIYDRAGVAYKRFTLNYTISDAGQAMEVLNILLLVCRGFLVYEGGTYGMYIEKAEPVSAIFDRTCASNFEMWASSSDDIYDKVNIEYIDPAYNYVRVQAPTEWLDIRRVTPLVKKVSLLGVNNFFQASRLSWFYLNQSQITQLFCKFRTDRRALLRTIGEVIELRDEPVLQYIAKKWRVLSIEEDDNGSYILTCREYNPDLYNETVGALAPTINESTLTDPFAPPKDVRNLKLSQVYYLQQDKTPVSYIQVNYDVDDLYNFKKARFYWTIDAVTTPTPWEYIGETYDTESFKIYNPEVGKTYYIRPIIENTYGKLSPGEVVGEITFTGKNLAPDRVDNFRAVEVSGGINLLWDINDEVDIAGYDLWHSTIKEENKIATLIGGAPVFYPTSEVGIHSFFIKAIDTAGNNSEPSYCSLSIIPPPKVTGFDVWQDGRDIFFKWDTITGDGVTYEIRFGSSWLLSQPIGRTDGDNLKVPWAISMDNVFWIKSVSKNGVYSTEATFGKWSMAEQPNRNLIYVLDKYNSWTGNKLFTEPMGTGLVLQDRKIRGDIIFPIELPFYCTSRNWVEYTPQRITVNSNINWDEATFAWADSRANSPWSDVTYHEDPVLVRNEIAIKKTEYPSDLIDYLTFNETLIGEYGMSPTNALGIAYGSARFNSGLSIVPKTSITYEGSILPEIFSFSCQVTINDKPEQDGTLTLLKNSSTEKFIRFAYDEINKLIYLERSDGIKIYSDIFINLDSYVLFVSQGEEKLTFGVYSWGLNRGFITEMVAPPLGEFTFFSPCGTI